MDLLSLCPLPATSFLWQAHTGAYALTIIVKATFLLKPGEAILSPTQEPIRVGERFWDDAPKRSVRFPSDRAPYKARPEVMLVGHAYAKGREPTRSLVARLVVGELDKSVEVWCDRGIRLQDNRLFEGKPFLRMPIGWEKAAGGPDTNNPVGMRFDAAPDQYGMVALPNVQPLGLDLAKRPERFASVGFGPLGSSWPTNRQKLGRYAETFRDPGWEKSIMPADFDSRYFQTAPLDQQVETIHPNERILLENLNPDHPQLSTALPGLRPRSIVDRATGEREEVHLVADTLWIDTDRALCCVVWRGRIGLRNAAEAGRIAVWVDGMPMVAPAATDGVEEEADGGFDAGMTLTGPLVKKAAAALPFVAGASGLAESDQQVAAEIARWAASSDDFGDGSGTMFAPLAKPAKSALPFGRQADENEDLAETIPPLPKANFEATPFMPVIPVMPPLQAFQVEGGGYLETGAAVVEEEPEKPRVEVAPPAMIGPIAVAEAARASEFVKEPPKAMPMEPAEQAADERNGLRIEEYPVERCARIEARLLCNAAETAEILQAENLDAGEWQKLHAHWLAAIRAETDRRKKTLLSKYDIAYVSELEKLRGQIGVDDYARIAEAAERGAQGDALAERGLPAAVWPNLHRVWIDRMTKDVRVGKDVREAMETVRVE